MDNTKEKNSSNPTDHTALLKEKFEELITHLRDDISKVSDPQAKALFEVSAEVLGGLKKAFADFEEKAEAAWKK